VLPKVAGLMEQVHVRTRVLLWKWFVAVCTTITVQYYHSGNIFTGPRTRPLSVQVQYSRFISSSCYISSLLTWTVVCLTAAKFKPHIFLVLRLALSNITNICILMILYDLCFLPA
jgi:hypothetical protein